MEILWVELLIGRAVLGLGLGSAQGGCWLDCESMVETDSDFSLLRVGPRLLLASLYLANPAFWRVKRLLGGGDA